MVRSFCTLTLVLLFPALVSARYCNSPYCAMCNSLFGPIQQQQQISYAAPKIITKSVIRDIGTPRAAVDTILSSFRIKSTDLFYDLGCNDGRVLIVARQKFGCRCIGIEKDWSAVQKARLAIKNAGFSSKEILILHADVMDIDISDANFVYLYQYPTTIKTFLPRIPQNCTIISFQHKIPLRKQWEIKRNAYTFYSITPDIAIQTN